MTDSECGNTEREEQIQGVGTLRERETDSGCGNIEGERNRFRVREHSWTDHNKIRRELKEPPDSGCVNPREGNTKLRVWEHLEERVCVVACMCWFHSLTLCSRAESRGTLAVSGESRGEDCAAHEAILVALVTSDSLWSLPVCLSFVSIWGWRLTGIMSSDASCTFGWSSPHDRRQWLCDSVRVQTRSLDVGPNPDVTPHQKSRAPNFSTTRGIFPLTSYLSYLRYLSVELGHVLPVLMCSSLHALPTRAADQGKIPLVPVVGLRSRSARWGQGQTQGQIQGQGQTQGVSFSCCRGCGPWLTFGCLFPSARFTDTPPPKKKGSGSQKQILDRFLKRAQIWSLMYFPVFLSLTRDDHQTWIFPPEAVRPCFRYMSRIQPIQHRSPTLDRSVQILPAQLSACARNVPISVCLRYSVACACWACGQKQGRKTLKTQNLQGDVRGDIPFPASARGFP